MQILGITSGSIFIGSPITIALKVASVKDATFLRAKYKVYVSGGGLSNTELEGSSPAESGEVIDINISSALQAHADRYQYSYDSLSAPVFLWHIEAWDEYMTNGDIIATEKRTSSTYSAIIGRVYDIERQKSSTGILQNVRRLTRKPTSSPETYPIGQSYVYVNPFTATGMSVSSTPSSSEVTFSELGLQKSYNVYVVDDSIDRYIFRFINSLGVMESVSVESFVEGSVNITNKSTIITAKETFNTFHRMRQTKSADFEKMKFVTQPLDIPWQQWFIHEFLMVSHCWVLIEGVWMSCHISSEDTVATVKRRENNILTVSFDVRLDNNGSILPELLI